MQTDWRVMITQSKRHRFHQHIQKQISKLYLHRRQYIQTPPDVWTFQHVCPIAAVHRSCFHMMDDNASVDLPYMRLPSFGPSRLLLRLSTYDPLFKQAPHVNYSPRFILLSLPSPSRPSHEPQHPPSAPSTCPLRCIPTPLIIPATPAGPCRRRLAPLAAAALGLSLSHRLLRKQAQ